MVSTRHHPREFPPPEASPTKGSPRKSSRNSTSSPGPDSSPSQSLAKRAAAAVIPNGASTSSRGWSHTATNITIAWLALSVPLQIWDTLYILLRPHTMAGGKLQWPIWKPYEIYAVIDHVYGAPGWENKDGFGGAQGALNGIETILYGLYLTIVFNNGVPIAGSWISGGWKISGKTGNRALIIGFAAAVMTLSKTILYYFNEYFSEFANIRHNDWQTLIIFYGVMNGLWVVFPAYMTIVFGADLIEALDIATESSAATKKRN